MHGDFDTIIERILAAGPAGGRCLVAIDGIGASGKTMFAAEVAHRVPDRPVITVHVDDFFNPTRMRHRRGRHSAEGFWLDAYNYGALVAWALEPLHANGDGRYRTGSYRAGELATPDRQQAPAEALVLVEGTFLHRDELASRWDFSIFLDIPFDLARRRMMRRDKLSEDAAESLLRRYQDAQRLYFAAAEPWLRADLVIDHTDPAAPRIIDPQSRSGE